MFQIARRSLVVRSSWLRGKSAFCHFFGHGLHGTRLSFRLRRIGEKSRLLFESRSRFMPRFPLHKLGTELPTPRVRRSVRTRTIKGAQSAKRFEKTQPLPLSYQVLVVS